MNECPRSEFHDLNLASRKIEEAAWRRYDAVQWLESEVDPLGIPKRPSEREFICCLRNGLTLCNAINKILPGAVPKVVDNDVPSQSLSRDSQPLHAYQYFENVRNFLVAVEELKLPAFEASDLERDTLETGSGAKVVDFILALKSYQELKQISTAKSPLVKHSACATRIHSGAVATFPSDACRRLDLSATLEKEPLLEDDYQKPKEIGELIVKLLVDYMVDAKENINGNLADSLCNGHLDLLKERSSLPSYSTSTSSDDFSAPKSSKCCRVCSDKGTCSYRQHFQMQEKELLNLKALKLKIKNEFEGWQSQYQRDMYDLGSQVQELSTAALGYHRVMNENRNLYNMVQDLKGNIRVYCRIRPSFSAESQNVIDFIGEDGSLVTLDPSKLQKNSRKVFQFNRIFGPTATQDEVFKDTQPLIRSVMDGYNVCIFAYGQTGSGKTHTMSGPSGGSSKDMGINYLALNDLFQMSNQRKGTTDYDIYVQMVEIYNEQVRDLLADEKTNHKLEIRSCNGNGLSLPDATLSPVKSRTDVLNLMKLGEVNRVVCSTAINHQSSRSRSVLTVHVYGKDVSGSVSRSCLHLVDLAGSERVDKSQVTGERLREVQFINKSLSCLGDVITALAQKNSHIPYRNSKLTLLLQDSLGGHAKTLMFAHVSPEEVSFGETFSTLKFAQRVLTVELGAARLNKESNRVMQLKAEIENLKIALANKEARRLLSNRTKEPQASSEKTPLRIRRLSIENYNASETEKPLNPEDRSGTKSPSFLSYSRRLSLEGSKSIKKDSTRSKVITDVSFESVSPQKYRPLQDAEAGSKLYGLSSNRNSKLELHTKAPRSPTITSINYQKRLMEVDGGIQIHPLKLPETPEPQVLARIDARKAVPIDLALCTDSQTPNVISSRSGKGSQIRRSLRTIGKLIHGSEKRSQQNLVEVKSPIRGTTHVEDAKSPRTAVASKKRRQSLTGPEKPRGSSLGGKSFVCNENDHRNEKSPLQPLRLQNGGYGTPKAR